MQDALSFLREQAPDGLLPSAGQVEAAARYSLTANEVEELSLVNGILPVRYQRNQKMISTVQQLTLLKSRVAVIGCGGLGGYIIEELARLGVGNILAVDPDDFEEHNLNRQLFSTQSLIGEKKVASAGLRVAAVNPAVRFQGVAKAFDNTNGHELLQGVDVVADGLDSIPVRLNLARICNELEIPLVHGAVAGWFGHLATQFPGENILEQIYSQQGESGGIETSLGCPSFTPPLIASLEVAEIVKILLQTGESVRNKYITIDLYHMEINEISFAKE